MKSILDSAKFKKLTELPDLMKISNEITYKTSESGLAIAKHVNDLVSKIVIKGAI